MSYREYSNIVIAFLLAVILIAPVVSYAKIIPCSGVIGISCPIVPCEECSIEDLIELANRLINFMLFQLAMPAAIVSFIVGGFMMITSKGDTGQLETGKSIFYYALIGFIIAFGAFLIVKLIISTMASGETISNLRKYIDI